MDEPDPVEPVAEDAEERSEEDEHLEERVRGLERLAAAAERTDERPGLLRAARALRRMLPGDPELGDPLSTAGDQPSAAIARRVAEARSERPSAARELGLGAIQIWQALSEAQGRGRGDEDLAILFTDLVDFSDWALEAGDSAVLDLLRVVGRVVEPPITVRGGRVVKRLGDGLMAVFLEPLAAVEAALEASHAVANVDFHGHHPALRAGVHFGRPRHIGGDYVGVDVNVAARVMSAAGEGEVLISDTVRESVGEDAIKLRKRRFFRAKGAPKDLAVYAVDVG